MKTALLAITACIIVLSSCKKDASSSPAANSYRLKSYTDAVTQPNNSHSVDTFNFSYDDSGRVASIISSTGVKDVYTYPGNNDYIMDVYVANKLNFQEHSFFNSKFLRDSFFTYSPGYDTVTSKFFYNAASQLVQWKYYDYSQRYGLMLSTTNYTYDASGNMIKSSNTEGNVVTYEYYTDLSYVMPEVSGSLSPGTAKKMNLVKKMTLTYSTYPGSTRDYTYTFDSNNRISTQKFVSSDGTVVVRTFTYL